MVWEAALVGEGVLDYPTPSDTELRQTRVSETTALGLTLYGGELESQQLPFLRVHNLHFAISSHCLTIRRRHRNFFVFSTTQLDTQVCHKGIDSLTC